MVVLATREWAAEATALGPVDLLVGHSLGALVTLELVGRRPGFARRLVVEDPPGSGSIDWAGLAAGIEADTRRPPTSPTATVRRSRPRSATATPSTSRRSSPPRSSPSSCSWPRRPSTPG